jgi:hypothetical protein
MNVNNNGNSNNNNANNSNGVSFGSSPGVRLLLGRQSNPRGEIWLRGREGEHDLPTKVNKDFDKSGRTLLAWYRLMGDLIFHAR